MQSVTLDGEKIYPSKVVCIGRNYAEHIRELANDIPDQPVLFIKPNSAISDRLISGEQTAIHYEGEIAFCVHDGALSAVGFGLDLTKRDVQSELKAKGLPWERAKAFDGSAVFSEFVSFSGDVSGLHMELFINGELVQSGGYDLMLYKPAEVLAEIVGHFTLADGDLILTGTPKGVGRLNAGDEFHARLFDQHALLVEATWIVE